jgi:hypothetical protein
MEVIMCLTELRDRILTLPALEKRMGIMLGEIRKAESEVADRLRVYERESRDTERLQKDSFSAFLFKLIGKYEDKLEKEQREEINAKIDYDRAVVHLETLISEKDELTAQISGLKSEERKYQAELNSRRYELSCKLSEPNGVLYAELEKQRKDILSQITEIEKALKVAYRAKSTAQTTLKSLDSAEGWATFDAFTRGGLISHMAKYSHIDDAEKNFNVLSHNLRELKAELSDVQGLTVGGLNEISSGQRAVDFWFDNIFTDLSVRSQIKDNIEQINRLIRNINTVESKLKTKKRKKERAYSLNRRREEELLVQIK